jgi:hypothetical protein
MGGLSEGQQAVGIGRQDYSRRDAEAQRMTENEI